MSVDTGRTVGTEDAIAGGTGGDGTGAAPHHRHHRDGGVTFWVAVVLGWAVIILGLRAGLNDREFRPGELVRWVAGGLVLHDAIWLTVVAVAGAALARAVRGRVPVVFGWALGTTAVLVVVAWPFVRGYGRRSDLPSALDRNYAQGLLAYVAVVWVAAAAWWVIARRRDTGASPVDDRARSGAADGVPQRDEVES